MEEDKLTIKNSMIWNSLGSMIYLVALWLCSIIVVRISGYGAAGVFSLALSISNTTQSIALAGVRNYQISDINNRFSADTYVVARYITATISMLVVISVVVVGDYTVLETMSIIAMGLYKIIDAIVDVYQGILQKAWRLDIVGKSLIIRGVSIVLTFSVIFYFTDNVFWAIMGMAVISEIIFRVLEYRYSMKIEKMDIMKKINWEDIKKLLIISLPLLIYTSILNTYATVPRMILQWKDGQEALGIYASVATPTVFVQVAATYIFTPLIAVFAKHYMDSNLKKFNSLLFKCIASFIGIILLAIVVCVFLGDWGLSILFGKEIILYSYLLIPTVCVTGIMALVLFLCMILTIFRKLGSLVWANIIGIIVCVLISLWQVSLNGMQGVNYSLIISLLILVGILSCVIIRTEIEIYQNKNKI